jgi:hypothetical protein
MGGTRIYNVKGLNEIYFYEKIVEYYQKSIQIHAPRCGDDSLVVLYQMLNKEHVALLDPKFHVVLHNGSLEDVNDIYHFHFTGPNKKYWDICENVTDLEKFFQNKFISYIYDNFDSKFINNYLPSVYLDITKCIPRFYYYRLENNFGDLITPYFFQKILSRKLFDFFG